jgi:hypothetical protein
MDRASGSDSEICWSGALHDRLNGLERPHLFAKRGDLVLQADGPGLRQLALLTVGRFQGRHVAIDTGLDLLHPLLQLSLGEVLAWSSALNRSSLMDWTGL